MNISNVGTTVAVSTPGKWRAYAGGNLLGEFDSMDKAWRCVVQGESADFRKTCISYIINEERCLIYCVPRYPNVQYYSVPGSPCPKVEYLPWPAPMGAGVGSR